MLRKREKRVILGVILLVLLCTFTLGKVILQNSWKNESKEEQLKSLINIDKKSDKFMATYFEEVKGLSESGTWNPHKRVK